MTPTNTPGDFTNAELRAAVELYREMSDGGKTVFLCDFRRRLRCSRERATILKKAAEFAVRVQDKYSKQKENK